MGAKPGQFQQGGQQVFVLVVTADAHTGWHLARIANDQRHMQHIVIDAVMVEPAFVIIERFAMIAIQRDDGVVGHAQRIQRFEKALDASVHIGDRAVVLGDDIIFVADARRHPRFEEIGKGLEGQHRVHAAVVGVGFIAMIKHALIGGGRQVGRVWVHVAQHDEPGFVFRAQPLQFWDGDLIEILGFGASALLPTAPAGIVDVVVEAASAGVACEADASAVVAMLAQDLGGRGRFCAQRSLVAQRDNLRAEAVAPGQHRGIGGRGGDVRAEGFFKKRARPGKAVDVRRGLALVSITRHVVGADRVDRNEQYVGLSWHGLLLTLDWAAV